MVLQLVAGILVVALTAVVIYAVVWRYLGFPPRWYDEVASIMLVWLTYYGGALAALKRGHIGVDGVLMAMPPRLRIAMAAVAEVFIIGFFIVLAWTGVVVLQVLEGMTLIALTWVPVQFTQSVIPIGAALFIIAQLLSMPARLARVRAGMSQEHEEIQDAIAKAEELLAREHERTVSGDAEKGRP